MKHILFPILIIFSMRANAQYIGDPEPQGSKPVINYILSWRTWYQG